MVGTSESHKISKPLGCLSQLKRKKERFFLEKWFGSNWWGVPMHQLSFSSKEKP
jgi:hypothetical protein